MKNKYLFSKTPFSDFCFGCSWLEKFGCGGRWGGVLRVLRVLRVSGSGSGQRIKGGPKLLKWLVFKGSIPFPTRIHLSFAALSTRFQIASMQRSRLHYCRFTPFFTGSEKPRKAPKSPEKPQRLQIHTRFTLNLIQLLLLFIKPIL